METIPNSYTHNGDLWSITLEIQVHNKKATYMQLLISLHLRF